MVYVFFRFYCYNTFGENFVRSFELSVAGLIMKITFRSKPLGDGQMLFVNTY